MKQFFITVAGVFSGLLLFFIGLPILLIASFANSDTSQKSTAHGALSIDLREGLNDQPSSSGFSGFGGPSLSTVGLVQMLKVAETDDKIKLLYVRLPESGMSPAAVEELRTAFTSFRKANKPVIVHSQGIYPAGPTPATYALGTAASEFWMQPHSSLQVTGMSSSAMFFKRAYDKFGLKPEYEQRYEYKNAVNPQTQSDYTPAHRTATLSLLNSIYDNALIAAAKDRKLDPKALRTLLEAGPYLAEEAKSKGLIDKVGQVQEVEAAVLERAGKDSELVDIHEYASQQRQQLKLKAQGADTTIALIGGEGAIMTGKGSGNPFSNDRNISSDDISEAFTKAIKDKSVKAIVFRVSSPGGSDTASEQILASVKAAKAAGKPVVVSMGNYAASGGYWVSSQASAIVAQPSTITGSIGVFIGRLAYADALARFGVDARQITIGSDYAATFTSAQGFTPSQRAAISHWADSIYDAFIDRVAKGRNLSPEKVREIAKGRVWTGVQAKQLGLVDELGGLDVAVEKAKQLAKIDAKTKVPLKTFPEEESPFAALSKAFGVSSDMGRGLAMLGILSKDPRVTTLMDRATEAQLRDRGATVLTEKPAY